MKRRATHQLALTIKVPKLSHDHGPCMTLQSPMEICEPGTPPTTAHTKHEPVLHAPHPKPSCRSQEIKILLKNMEKLEVDLHLTRARNASRSPKKNKEERAAHKKFVRMINAMTDLQITKESNAAAEMDRASKRTRVRQAGHHLTLPTQAPKKPHASIPYIQFPLPSPTSIKFTIPRSPTNTTLKAPASYADADTDAKMVKTHNTPAAETPMIHTSPIFAPLFTSPVAPTAGVDYTCSDAHSVDQITQGLLCLMSDRQEVRGWLNSLPGADDLSYLQRGGDEGPGGKYVYSI